VRGVLGLCVLVVGGALSVLMAVALALSLAYPNLPDVGSLTDYRPKLPLRVLAADGQLLGEFGEERRIYVPIGEIPKVMKDAVLAIEDANFYRHGGVDFKGIARAALAQFSEAKSQGASTITMQLARNFYLSTEKTFTRKIYEVLLAFKIESMLSKDQILEIYMNQIFLGHRAHGFAAASDVYFGKPLKQITVAEAVKLMTANAAQQLGIGDRTGTLEAGKAADLAVWDIERPAELAYWLGKPLLAKRMVAGVWDV
jgi:penicillin-binding protein 1A